MIQKAVALLLGKPEIQFPLEAHVPELRVLVAPEQLRISLCQGDPKPLQTQVSVDDSVSAGQVLAVGGAGCILAAPVAGTIKAITGQPDIRGTRKGSAILLEPSSDPSEEAFAPLHWERAGCDILAQRLSEAGILSSRRTPIPLISEMRPACGSKVDTVVVLAADRDPGVSVALQLLQERMGDIGLAARMLGRIASAARVVVAHLEGQDHGLAAADGLELLPLPAMYPHTLREAIQRRLGGTPSGTPVIPVETALAALDAVREGRVQRDKLLTLIGPDQKPIANYRVSLGTPILDVLRHAGLSPGEHDKVVTGGPLRGFALYSLLGSIDAGVDGLTLIPADRFPNWSAEPCINCGRCIDICPLNLQVQLIARYAEFELFDETQQYGIDECFECGLCAVVCTARRPLLQYIRLAKSGLEATE